MSRRVAVQSVIQEIEESRRDETDTINSNTTESYGGERNFLRKYNTIDTVIKKTKRKQAKAEDLDQKDIFKFKRLYVTFQTLPYWLLRQTAATSS